jgi:hypothetical protein
LKTDRTKFPTTVTPQPSAPGYSFLIMLRGCPEGVKHGGFDLCRSDE